MKVHVEITVTVGRSLPPEEVEQRYTLTSDVPMSDNPLYVLRAVATGIEEATGQVVAAVTAVNGDIDE